MFWLRWLVTAESSSDPHAAISSHSVLSLDWAQRQESSDGAAAVAAWELWRTATLTAADGCCSALATSGTFLLLAMMTPQTTTNIRNPTDHASVCVRRLKFGSTSTG